MERFMCVPGLPVSKGRYQLVVEAFAIHLQESNTKAPGVPNHQLGYTFGSIGYFN